MLALPLPLVALATLPAAAGGLGFTAPVRVAPARGPGEHPTYAASFYTLRGSVMIGQSGANARLYASTDGSRSWAAWLDGKLGGGTGGTLLAAPGHPAELHSMGADPTTGGWLLNGSARSTFVGSGNVTVFGAAAGGEPLSRRFVSQRTSFASLPVPLACRGADCFWTSGAGTVRLPDGTYLQTTVIPWLGGEFGAQASASGVHAWSSNDTFAWSFVGTVATAAQFPDSGEGPNENSLSLAADGRTVVCVMRLDGGDGLRWGDHRTKNYHLARSTSGGRSWSKATELRDANGHGVGTARPRLLLLGSKLLLSGGRLTTEQQGGVFLWVSDDGFGRSWRTTSLSFKHNQLESDPALRFPDRVNTTLDLPGCVSKGKPWPDCPKDKSKLGCPHHFKNCSSTGYTSLLPAGDDAVVVYDGPPGIFAMRVSLADEDVQ